MREARKTPEEQYRLVIECRKSGMSDCDWCRANGINPETFYTWITRLRKKGGFLIPPAQKQSSCQNLPHDIARVDVLPEESLRESDDDENTFIPPALIGKSYAAPSLAAGILKNKFVLGLPFYRQEHDLKRSGI